MRMKWQITKSCRPLRGLDVWLRYVPGIPLRSTPGFTLSPAPQAENVALKLFPNQFLHPLHGVCRSESQLLHYDLNRRRSPVMVEANHVAFLADVLRPAQSHAGFDRESRVDARRKHFVAVSLRLFFE